MNISIELSEPQIQSLVKAFRRARYQDNTTIVEQLAQLAVNSWVDWLSGGKRYKSLTDQYSDWIEQIYTALLPETEAPSLDRLYNSFNLPLGQAQYIERILSNKSLSQWREKAKNELKTAMQNKLNIVDEALRTNRADANIEITVSKLAYLEFKTTFERLFLESIDLIPPIVNSSGFLFSVRIAAGCFRRILDAIE